MRTAPARLGTALLWTSLATLVAALYGVVNDQITVTLSPEYFSVFKRAQFGPDLEAAGLSQSPVRVQAVLVGILATWWFGGLLGAVLSLAGLAGRRCPLPTRDFLRAVLGIMLLTLCLSFFSFLAAYAAEPAVKPTAEGWPFLTGIQAVRAAFAVGWWHNAAYLGGLLGTILACVRIRNRRVLLA